MITRRVYVFVSFLAISLTAAGQKAEVKEKPKTQQGEVQESFASATTTLERNFRLDKDSKSEEMTVDIPQNSPKLELKLGSSVTSGKLTIEIYDSKDVKVGNYTIGSSSDKKTSGRITKNFKQPRPGVWKIKIIPEQATGDIWSVFLIYE